MKRSKPLLATILSLIMLCGALTGCGAGETQDAQGNAPAQETQEEQGTQAEVATGEYPPLKVKDNLTVGYVVMDVKADSQQRSLWQARIECEHRGWTFVDGSCEGDELTRDAINNLINQDVDVIILGNNLINQDVDVIILGNMALMDAKVDLMQKAREAGIGVYCNDNQVVEGVVAGSSMEQGGATKALLNKVSEDHPEMLNVCMTYENNEVNLLRRDAAKEVWAAEPEKYTFLAEDDTFANGTFYLQAAYEYGQTWLQKYGDDLNFIFSTWDGEGESVAEAISQSGDPTGEKTFVAGIDGGNSAWAYIRNNTPLQYTYSQPFELYTHDLFEVIAQIQQKGLKPGDEGCAISEWGETLYNVGHVTTRENVPEIGQPVHAVFEYYGEDPEDPEAWFNWEDGPGIYYVADGTEEVENAE